MASKDNTTKVIKETPVLKVTKEKQDLRKKEPPLIDLKVTNPVTYIKSWWKKIIGNEGIDFRFRVKPLTAIAISIIVVTVSMGVGRFVLPFKIPFFEYTSKLEPSPTPILNPWRQTAFSGELRFTAPPGKFYLLTVSSEAITLDIPDNVDLTTLIGERIFATGEYNSDTRTLIVENASGLEVLPEEIEPVPTSIPTPTPTPLENNSTSSAELN